jgi:hypothetical protein
MIQAGMPMAGFRTHITVSTLGGVAYGYAGARLGLAIPTCVLAGGLCLIAGMMPDLDSDSGVPARETIGFAAAIVPMLMLHQMQAHGLSIEQMVLAGAPIYLSIRFGIGWLLKTLSVHRGMFHSIPAAVIAGLMGFLICDSGTPFSRYYKALAVTLGYLIHLVLDEIWSVDFGAGIPRVKKSLGTAMKLFGDELGPNLVTYCLLAALGYTAFEEDPSFWKNITSIRELRDAETTATKPGLDAATR